MRRLIPLLMSMAIGLSACAPHKPSPKADNFPVVVPFALDRAGSKITVEFELPNALDPHLPEPTLRPVFIGVRWVSPSGKGSSDEEFRRWVRRKDYLNREPIPVRVMLRRWEQSEWVPVILQEMHDNVGRSTGNVWYEPIAENGIVARLKPAGTDNDALMAVGKYDSSKAYVAHEFVRISPPTPGRYRLQVESLGSHSAIQGETFELLVSHNSHYGIR